MRTIVLRGLNVVDRARADDDDEAVVGIIEDGLHGLAGSDDGLPGRLREGQLLAQAGRRKERANVADAGILSALREAARQISSRKDSPAGTIMLFPFEDLGYPNWYA